jgi:Mg2+ and Co2+ transporter CorA
LKDEIISLSTVTGETVEILRRVEGGRVMLHPDLEDAKSFFNRSDMHYANGLYVHAAQINSYRLDLTNEILDSIAKLDRLQNKALVLATHRVTALGAMILFPNLIFDFFGQSFAPLPDWIKSNGWWCTIVLTTAYWIGQYAYMRRRRYI